MENFKNNLETQVFAKEIINLHKEKLNALINAINVNIAKDTLILEKYKFFLDVFDNSLDFKNSYLESENIKTHFDTYFTSFFYHYFIFDLSNKEKKELTDYQKKEIFKALKDLLKFYATYLDKKIFLSILAGFEFYHIFDSYNYLEIFKENENNDSVLHYYYSVYKEKSLYYFENFMQIFDIYEF